MKLKFKYDKEEDIPKEQRPFYVESSGAFILDGEDLAARGDVEYLENRLKHMEMELGDRKAEYDKAIAAEIEQRRRHETEIAELRRNRGSGASPNLEAPASGGQKSNPFVTGNLTEQAKLYRENPIDYERLSRAAGK
jgi:hypothetical protein